MSSSIRLPKRPSILLTNHGVSQSSALYYPWGRRLPSRTASNWHQPRLQSSKQLPQRHGSEGHFVWNRETEQAARKVLAKGAVWGTVYKRGDINAKRDNFKKLYRGTNSCKSLVKDRHSRGGEETQTLWMPLHSKALLHSQTESKKTLLASFNSAAVRLDSRNHKPADSPHKAVGNRAAGLMVRSQAWERFDGSGKDRERSLSQATLKPKQPRILV